jgi:hypothetical protein
MSSGTGTKQPESYKEIRGRFKVGNEYFRILLKNIQNSFTRCLVWVSNFVAPYGNNVGWRWEITKWPRLVC